MEEQSTFNEETLADKVINSSNENKNLETDATQIENESVVNNSSHQKRKKKGAIKKILIGVAIILAIAIAVIIVLFVFRGKNDHIFYLKDDQIYFSDFSKNGIIELSSSLSDEEITDSSDYYDISTALGMLLTVADNGTVFYIDEIDDNGYSLYYRKSNNPNEKGTKIDSNITSFYFIDKSAKYVTYLKDDSLYKYSLSKNEKEKIASDVLSFCASDDNSLIYLNTDSELYYNEGNKAAVKLDSDITEVKYINDEFNRFYYIKDEALYVNTPDDERQKIADDVYEYSMYFYNSGEIFYKITDDESYDNSLYYYDGTHSTKITDADTYIDAISADKAVIIYSEYDEDYNETYFIAVGGKSYEFADEDANSFTISDDGKTVYYTVEDSDEDDESGAPLYKVKITNGIPGNPMLYDTDISGPLYLLNNDTLCYYKDYDEFNYSGDLYLNKEIIDYDVYAYSLTYIESSKDLVYLTDWDAENENGTLKIYNKNSMRICDDVHCFRITPNGKITYLTNYSNKHYRGELYVYSNNQSKKIDDDVNCIIQPFDISEYMSYLISWFLF